ncbi:MAG: hypothetical protein AAF573_01680 [Bacteroidota bacterium]
MKNSDLLLFPILIFLFFIGCAVPTENEVSSTNINPPAEGFDSKNSSPEAIKIADEVMLAMGGRKAYDDARYLFWNFFGSRTLLWDKHTGDVRIESQRDSFTVAMNIHSMKGKVKLKEEELTHPDSLSKYLQKGKDIWINDAYWLVMPFKLKDSGVTLKYMGEESKDGKNRTVLDLTFKNVGKTPQNKYRVYVDQATHLINQWDFYPNATDEQPRFSTPWKDYKKYGNILLSGDRGQYKLTDIAVLEKVDDGIFEEL